MNALRVAIKPRGGQNTAVHWQQMRRELDTHVTPRNGREFLVELAQVPMRAANRIGLRALGQFGMEKVFFQRPPCPGDPAFQVKDDAVKVDAPGFDQRTQDILAGRRIAAGPCYQTRGADIIAVKTRSGHRRPLPATLARHGLGHTIARKLPDRAAGNRRTGPRFSTRAGKSLMTA